MSTIQHVHRLAMLQEQLLGNMEDILKTTSTTFIQKNRIFFWRQNHI